jgi:hypothetical protein
MVSREQRIGRLNTLSGQCTTDAALAKQLLARFDGLPLAIAQAGVYLQESESEPEAYLQFYEQQWSELMQFRDSDDALLQDYPDRSV